MIPLFFPGKGINQVDGLFAEPVPDICEFAGFEFFVLQFYNQAEDFGDLGR
jgi:hypothetical protein